MAETIKTSVQRYNPDNDDAPYLQDFEVEYEVGMTVLDALLYVQDKFDSSLAFRWECRGGQCGSCAVKVNGTARIACRTKVDPEESLVLEPLDKMPIIKDLVVDMAQTEYRIRRIRPYVARDKKPERPEIIHAEEIEKVREIRKCIECAACLSNCPIVHETWEYPGPMIIRQIARLELDPRDVEDRVGMAIDESVYSCTTCKMCTDICPKKIDVPALAVELLRAKAVEAGYPLAEGQQGFIDQINATGRAVPEKDAPLLKALETEEFTVENSRGRVGFFTGCLIDYRMQNTGKALIEVLNRNGVDVIVPKEQWCCASPAFRTGDLHTAHAAVERVTEIFENAMDKHGFDTVVVACAGCGKTLREDHRPVITEKRGEPPKFKVHDLAEYMLDVIGKENLVLPKGEIKLKITYHEPCHLGRGQGVVDQPVELLKMIPGVEYIEDPYRNRCCGAGGGVRAGKRELSQKIATTKREYIEATGASMITTECPFCTIQISDILEGSEIETRYIPDLLAESYRKGDK
ncbi:MAG: succinate dehydrogenase/fumarate reductase iron-sulfur subunit [Candidatus Thorarchaeota archaeon]|nr:MAG: succinate dehydrogenase/fumarate reductase iron-sulfur subunit [Candidatus Thorarchaeota archaeon]